MGIQSGEWRARCGAFPSGALSGALIRASSGAPSGPATCKHRASNGVRAGRARAARKSIMVLTFCVRRSPGDSAAATGWSGERRPMGPLAVFLP